ncbi:uncharacterized protein K02A2.6-like [Saccostrea cucullata]|uniref:uncharacterized protein K02A2.6-like n=1 Tax=Saccostrea cuccullata TaxID=36930 RepID=UPI002ED07E11
MALERLTPPGKIKFNTKNISEDWRKWREEFELYASLSVKDAEDKAKLQLLKYLIGADGREIYSTLKFEKEEKDRKLKDVLEAFDAYCRPKRNETVERFRFNIRKQEQGETIETFITDLKTLAAKCNYEEIVDSLCVDITRAAEITKQGISVLDGNNNSLSSHTENVNKIGKGKPSAKTSGSKHSHTDNNKPCKYCAKEHERKKENCPAYGKTCRLCHKMNHFETVCRSATKKSQPKYKKKTVHHIGTGCSVTDSDDDYSVWTIQEENTHSAHSVSNSAHASMIIHGKKVTFQLDSGATCNILPHSVIPNMPPLQPTNYTLKLYNKSTIRPLGKVHLQVTNPRNGTSYDTEFVVIKEDCMPLLGNKTLQHMELLNWRKENILSVRQLLPSPLSKKQLFAEYPDVFEGLGRLAGKYHLVLDENIQPVVHPPRKVPIALKPLLKAELDRLQEMKIITPVSEPTPWVSSCLMVVKPNKVRICIDPKDLNKALKRSHYPLRTIEEILPNLSRAKVFSVLDARNGFWHVELDKESSMLTTFNTPFGRFRWLRMPFGISTAPEEYQRRQDQAVEGLPGVLSIADDISVMVNATQKRMPL